MPAKNSIKIYMEDSYYHIYNRGVEKKPIFYDEQDSTVFNSYLSNYLLPKDEIKLRSRLSDPGVSSREKDRILRLLKLSNFYDEITLTAYSLMPNHFHFLVKQKSATSIDKFMNSLGIRYAMYFNRKYQRVGPIFQDVYKAVLIETEPQLLYLTKYIHRNSLEIFPSPKSGTQVDLLRAYASQPSSYPEYLGLRKTEWVHPEEILSYFSRSNPTLSYQNFAEANDNTDILESLEKIAIDI